MDLEKISKRVNQLFDAVTGQELDFVLRLLVSMLVSVADNADRATQRDVVNLLRKNLGLEDE